MDFITRLKESQLLYLARKTLLANLRTGAVSHLMRKKLLRQSLPPDPISRNSDLRLEKTAKSIFSHKS